MNGYGDKDIIKIWKNYNSESFLARIIDNLFCKHKNF